MKQSLAHGLMSKIKMPYPRIKARTLEFHLPTEKGVEVIYRVIIKEGQKVKCYYTAKIWVFEPEKVFLQTKNSEHFIIYIKLLQYFIYNFNADKQEFFVSEN